MSWVGVAIGTGVLGAYTNYTNAEQQRKQKKEEMMANAAQIQYSPWTHAAVQTEGYGATPNATTAGINGGLQGGIAGAMMASQFNKATPAPAAPAAPTAPMPQAGGSMDQGMGQQGMGNPNSAWNQLHQMQPNMYGYSNKPVVG